MDFGADDSFNARGSVGAQSGRAVYNVPEILELRMPWPLSGAVSCPIRTSRRTPWQIVTQMFIDVYGSGTLWYSLVLWQKWQKQKWSFESCGRTKDEKSMRNQGDLMRWTDVPPLNAQPCRCTTASPSCAAACSPLWSQATRNLSRVNMCHTMVPWTTHKIRVKQFRSMCWEVSILRQAPVSVIFVSFMFFWIEKMKNHISFSLEAEGLQADTMRKAQCRADKDSLNIFSSRGTDSTVLQTTRSLEARNAPMQSNGPPTPAPIASPFVQTFFMPATPCI